MSNSLNDHWGDESSPIVQEGGNLVNGHQEPVSQPRQRERGPVQAATRPEVVDPVSARYHDRFEKLVDSHKTLGQRLAEDIERGLFTREGVEAQSASFASSGRFEQQLDGILKDARSDAEASQAALDAAFTAVTTVTGSVNEQLLVETRDAKAWNRISAEIGSKRNTTPADHMFALGDRLAFTKDPAERRVILNEARPWLLSNGYTERESGSIDRYLRSRLTEVDTDLAALYQRARHAKELAFIVEANVSRLRPRLTSAPPTFRREPHGAEPTRRGRGYTNPAAARGR
ncbi:hypothetical protein [Microbacterium sp. E-13]|uniref:hypothetical protein n=1 Tax=Microbacterium sp. E-13 TaxID=3404048 RepID=UPI003CF3297B